MAGGPIPTTEGVDLDTTAVADLDLRVDDIVLVPGGAGVFDAAEEPGLVGWLRDRAPEARMVASTCTGAFLLAAAGLLDGRRAVTHWDDCDRLRRAHPSIRVEEDPIFVADDRIWTSAGVTAGIDLALAIVEADFGRAVALELARNLVVYAKRPGGQSQFSSHLRRQIRDAEARFAELHDWVRRNLAEDLRVERLAAHVGMSLRTFQRTYTASTHTTPARMVCRARVEAARRLLEETRGPVRMIADACGFGTEEQMRRSFHRELRVSPSAYRRG